MIHPLSFCMVREAIDTGNWGEFDKTLLHKFKLYKFECPDQPAYGCLCGKCLSLTEEETCLFNEHVKELLKNE